MNVNGIRNNSEQQSADSSETKSPCAHFLCPPLGDRGTGSPNFLSRPLNYIRPKIAEGANAATETSRQAKTMIII